MINIIFFQIFIISCLVATSCALPGIFLVLRANSLLSDAIGHAMLFGIVVTFFITKNLHSPLTFLGAIITGILTFSLTELLISTKRINFDAAIGLVFPLLFSLAIILINLYASSIHIDTDAVLLGELALTPFQKLIVNNIDYGPISLYLTSLVFIINSFVVFLLYPALKITIFDPDFAKIQGYNSHLIFYTLMTIVSITIVVAFEVAGAILVVSFMIVPASTAFLLTKNLFHLIMLTIIISLVGVVSGFLLGHAINGAIAPAIATMNGLIFFIILLLIKNMSWSDNPI